MGDSGRARTLLWISTRGPAPQSEIHVAFAADSREVVDAFHASALDAGATDNGEPGVREIYHPNYYGAYVLDPDGNNGEAVCHIGQPRVPSGGSVGRQAEVANVSKDEVIFLPPGAGRSYDVAPMRSVFRQTGPRPAIATASRSGGWRSGQPGPGRTRTSANEELFYVVEGTMSFLVGAAWIEAPRGSFLRVPLETTHDFETAPTPRPES